MQGPTRFLDALENMFYSSRKISDNLFYLVTYQNLSLFRISCQLSRKFAPWMPPPSAASCSSNDTFLFFSCHLPTFFTKTAPLDAPQVDARGRRTVRTPLCTPLILTNLFVHPKNKSILFVSVAIYSKYLACLPVSVGLRPAQLA